MTYKEVTEFLFNQFPQFQKEGDGIEVDWKQPDAEGGFWAWGLVHPASGAARACGAHVGPRSPRWGYFPLSCVLPPSPVESAVDEHYV